MYQEDFLMRQIEAIGRALAAILFHKRSKWQFQRTEEKNAYSGGLRRRLLDFIDEGRFNEAENLLFDTLRPEDKAYLNVAVDFYMRLNELDNDTLEAGNFPREEISEGLSDVLRLYQVNLPPELML